jgi:hypothetical protein
VVVPNRSTGTGQYIPGAEESERLIIQEELIREQLRISVSQSFYTSQKFVQPKIDA